MKSHGLTIAIVVGMVLGTLLGIVVHEAVPDPASVKAFADTVALLTTIFLRLIRMIIAPLVFSTLVAGIAGMPDLGTVGRIGGKTLLWFLAMSSLSIILGMVLAATLQPGVATGLTLPDAGSSGVGSSALTLTGFIEHLVPRSIVEAMANNEILQIVVFSLFFGTAALAIGAPAQPLVALIATLGQIMLTVTKYVMGFAPLAVFGAMAAVMARQGPGALAAYGRLLAEFFGGIALLWVVVIAAGFLVIGRRVFHLIARLRQPILLAFSTASSEAAYPGTLAVLERFGCSNRVASFVLPIGYSFNLDGSMMYSAFAVLFLMQVYGIRIGIGQALALGLTLMVTTKGIAGVPRASLVVIAAVLPSLGVPEAALLLLIGIDQFFDMARTATNVLGNGVATAVVARWEGQLGDERSAIIAAEI